MGHKTSLNKFQKAKTLQIRIPGQEVEVNNKKYLRISKYLEIEQQTSK